jgi:hypothetical protein
MAVKKKSAPVVEQKPVKKANKSSTSLSVAIDFPREGEQILSNHYAVRISTEAQGVIEVSINNGDWKQCRRAVGFGWFDWNPVKGGDYTLTARVLSSNGKQISSSPVKCRVVGTTLN